MSFHLYQGNRLDLLASVLAKLMAGEGDPYAEETVVVPSRGVSRWLALEIARINGFCPSVEWIRPGDFIYKYIFNPMRGIPADYDLSTFVPEVNVWELNSLLKKDIASSDRISRFLGNDDLKRWQLAGRMADLFDRYMTYRIEMLESWKQGQLVTGLPDEAWQCRLWRELTQNRKDMFSALAHEYLTGRAKPFTSAKPRFFFFADSSLPSVHLQCALKLAEQTEIYFFMPNPCETLWDDVKSRKAELRDAARLDKAAQGSLGEFYNYACNPLLGAMGRTGRDFFLMMLDQAWDHEEVSAFLPLKEEEPSLLRQLLADIQRNARRPKPDYAGETHSLSVHICHSAMREMEVLRDQLLLAFKEIPGLAPKDVRVYTPDLAAYEPFIEAVFSNSEAPQIPYRIAGRALAGEYPECAVFLQILNVLDSRFTASALLGILTSEPVMRRFGFSAEDADKLVALVAEAHAAWGLDHSYKASLGGADTDSNSWFFALDRLVLGVTCADPSMEQPPFATKDRQSVPEACAEGTANLVGALSDVLEALTSAQRFIANRASHTATEWLPFLRALRDVFLPNDGADGLIALDKLFASLGETLVRSRVADSAFPFAVLKSWLAGNVTAPPSFQDLSSGCVTFSGFSAGSPALPARVVAVIGMNDNAFPHPDMSYGFDLMAGRRKLGDPSRRDAERYLFLQTLLSARDRFIVTYTGRSERDNSVLPPSILIGELLDAIDLYLPQGRAAVTIEHPLLPFSPAYFEEGHDSRLISFSHTQAEIAKQTRLPLSPPKEAMPPLPGNPLVVDAEALIAMLTAPCKYFVENVVGASLDVEAGLEPQDVEPLSPPDSLQNYTIFDNLFALRLKRDIAAVRQAVMNRKTSGELSVLSPDEINSYVNTVEDLYNRFIKLDAGMQKEPASSCEIFLGKDKFTATFRSVFAKSTQVLVHPSGKVNGKFALRLLCYHLARLAAGLPVLNTIGITKGETLTFSGQDRKKAQEGLKELFEIYKTGLQQPLCFDIQLFWKAFQKRDGYTSENAQQAWTGGYNDNGASQYLRYRFGNDLDKENLAVFDSIAAKLAKIIGIFKGNNL